MSKPSIAITIWRAPELYAQLEQILRRRPDGDFFYLIDEDEKVSPVTDPVSYTHLHFPKLLRFDFSRIVVVFQTANIIAGRVPITGDAMRHGIGASRKRRPHRRRDRRYTAQHHEVFTCLSLIHI